MNIKNNLFLQIKSIIESKNEIISALSYGSWFYDEKSVDCDIAIIVRSNNGVICDYDYLSLIKIRLELCDLTNNDIDLVPHTEDELIDFNSPIFYPRYNPSLFFGQKIKGDFNVVNITSINNYFSFKDLCLYVLHDNRTICRRQIIRSLNKEETRIFVSKLAHGPGNAITYFCCKNKINYLCPPSDIKNSFSLFDSVFNVKSNKILFFIRKCKENMDINDALLLISWYERLFNVIFLNDKNSLDEYNQYCNIF